MSRPGNWVLLTILIAGLSPEIAAADADLARGAELLQPFKSELQRALQEGMAEGPVAAIDACRLKAPAIAADQAHNGIVVGRSSHRLRNPDNAPAPWMEPVLAEYLSDPGRRVPRALVLSANRRAYVEPIITQPLCLTCHGAEVTADVRDALARDYPQDAATGFKAGDLRGIYWVTFDALPPASGSR